MNTTSEEKFCRAVHREARDEVLQVERVPRAQAPLDRADRLVRVPLEDVEVRDPVLAEEGARHGAVEFPHVAVTIEYTDTQDVEALLNEVLPLMV